MLRQHRNASCSEWVAVGFEWRDLSEQLRSLDVSLRRRVLSDFVRRGDHFLPLGVLKLSVDSASRLELDDLRRFPGVGLVKIRNLFGLLQRVLRSDDACSAISEADIQANACGSSAAPDITEFEWSQWREALADSRLMREPIGRYVARLDDLPRGSWSIPMTDVAALSLEEIRELPGYGARRIGAITATFRTLMLLHSAVAHHRGAVVRWESIEIARADAWLVAAITEPGKATITGLQNEVIESLASQIRRDLGAGHVDDARKRALSPSRVRQIRQDVVMAIRVRWPRGEQLVNSFLRNIGTDWTSKNSEAAIRSLGMFFSRLRPSSQFTNTTSQPSLSTPVIHALKEVTAFGHESTI